MSLTITMMMQRCAQVHYMGTFEDGTVFDSSREAGEPYEFVVGSTRVVPGFNEAVAGLGVGQSRRHTMKPADAYGTPPTVAGSRCTWHGIGGGVRPYWRDSRVPAATQQKGPLD